MIKTLFHHNRFGYIDEVESTRISLLFSAVRYLHGLYGSERQKKMRDLYRLTNHDKSMTTMLRNGLGDSYSFSPLVGVLEIRENGHRCSCKKQITTNA